VLESEGKRYAWSLIGVGILTYGMRHRNMIVSRIALPSFAEDEIESWEDLSVDGFDDDD